MEDILVFEVRRLVQKLAEVLGYLNLAVLTGWNDMFQKNPDVVDDFSVSVQQIRVASRGSKGEILPCEV